MAPTEFSGANTVRGVLEAVDQFDPVVLAAALALYGVNPNFALTV